mgnify:CR=1 FL=1
MGQFKRFWEIDACRGIFVILMIFFNYSFALKYLGIFTLVAASNWLYWYLFPRIIGGTFIFIAGISLTLMYNKYHNLRPIVLRGLKIFAYGLGITLVTWLFFPDVFVRFGILHLIGASIILSLPFLRFREINILFGAILAAAGFYLQTISFDFSWLLWLGFIPHNFYTFDYFPILPWFGVMVIGIGFGNMLYPSGKRCFIIHESLKNPLACYLAFIGRNSLIFYLAHQPILILVLILSGLITLSLPFILT